jgi:hypothetical protein
MDNAKPIWLQNLQLSDLALVVSQVLDQPSVEILDCQAKKFSGGAAEYTGRGQGVCRVTGTARVGQQERTWSVVLKGTGPSEIPSNNDPAWPEYWKREVLAYQSGVLKQLPAGIIAPRCYAVDELPNGECRIWLEDIQQVEGEWTMEQHHLTARHLGQFNGAYLAGHPLPAQAEWMLPGRTRQWVENIPPDRDRLMQFSETTMGHWLPKQSVERLVRLWEQRQVLLAALDRLPTCFCHHDAFRRNLMLRKTDNDTLETVAIDWSYTGYGKVGQEIGLTTGTSLFFMEVPATRAKELDEAVFSGYCAGLREAGWEGDLRLARFGYTVTAALTSGVAFATIITGLLATPEDIATGEAIVGHPIDEQLAQWGVLEPFLLDLGDEALALMSQ